MSTYIIVGDGVVEGGVGASEADGFLIVGTGRLLLPLKVANVHRLATCMPRLLIQLLVL